MSAVLTTKEITMQFGGLTAVDSLSLEIHQNDLVGLIGPNGAGKTTAFNMITGHYLPTRGEVLLQNEKINGVRPAIITQKGIARTFQNIRLFKDLTVLDNIRIAAHSRCQYSFMDSIFRTKKFKAHEEKIEEEAMQLLSIFKMQGYRDHLAKNLPYGMQRRLEMARAMATKPSLLLLDEPAAGMNPNETVELTKLIRWIRDEFKLAILLIEHDMRLVMDVCERIYVLDYGKTIAKGTPEEIQNNPKVIDAYLGAEHD